MRDVFFFFKQKTAYEMRISDWSSDVCSSDLRLRSAHRCDRVDMAAPQGAGTTPNGDHPVAEGIGTHAGNPVEIFAAEGAFGGAVMGPRPGQDFEQAGPARQFIVHGIRLLYARG